MSPLVINSFCIPLLTLWTIILHDSQMLQKTSGVPEWEGRWLASYSMLWPTVYFCNTKCLKDAEPEASLGTGVWSRHLPVPSTISRQTLLIDPSILYLQAWMCPEPFPTPLSRLLFIKKKHLTFTGQLYGWIQEKWDSMSFTRSESYPETQFNLIPKPRVLSHFPLTSAFSCCGGQLWQVQQKEHQVENGKTSGLLKMSQVILSFFSLSWG